MCPYFCVFIYMNLTNTSRDPGWLNWEFDYKILSFYYWGPSGHTGDMLMSYIPEQKYRSFDYKTEQPFDGALTILCKGATLQ